MQPGVHYHPNTYAPTPNVNTTRILMALVVKYGLYQKCFDIEKAYTWSELDKGSLIILKCPTGFERYDPETGEELYAIMRRNLYGTPNAAINYVRTRDDFILKAFNKDGWTCQRSVMDPSLFWLTRNGKNTWMVAFVAVQG